ncbi:MAG TPA: metalloregulator ArsR/SmtB family transcription factor [Candidatus Anaerobiospirillum stercoravium]|nr:metalloregulator ArsR/SmtB family transcription factor [Candidatus Anaerobiospirillum stercoravium]
MPRKSQAANASKAARASRGPAAAPTDTPTDAALSATTPKSQAAAAQAAPPREPAGTGTGGGSAEPNLEADLADGLLPSDDVEILSAFFKALSDPSRLNIVCVLLKYHQLSVGDIAAKINMSVSAVSHQLAILRMRKLVMVKRDGVKNYYALCDDHVAQVIEMAIEHINE